MAETKSIYIVKTGCYSDYGIDSVWEDVYSAETRAKFLSGIAFKDSPRVEEYRIGVVERSPYLKVEVNPFGEARVLYESNGGNDGESDGIYYTHVHTDTIERAIKVAKERWRAWMADAPIREAEAEKKRLAEQKRREAIKAEREKILGATEAEYEAIRLAYMKEMNGHD